jgi:alpha-mannosidase
MLWRKYAKENFMLTDRQINQMMVKLKRFESTLDRLLFEKADVISMSAFPTDGKYHRIPENDNFTPCHENDSWEGEGTYCWFIGQYTVPAQLKGKTLYIYPKIDAYEGLLWVNGKPFGNFSEKIKNYDHGLHYCDMLKQNVGENEKIDIALECYAHHYVIGTSPLEINPDKDFKITFHEVDVCIKNEEIWDVYFNLKIVNQMVDALDSNSFRRAQIIQTLKAVHEILYYDY